jgi:hypothetical protein
LLAQRRLWSFIGRAAVACESAAVSACGELVANVIGFIGYQLCARRMIER